MQATSISTLSVITVLWASSLSAQAQDDWKAPREAAARRNPIATSADSIELGRAVFARACVSCHGETGVGDGFAAAMLKRKPKDMAEVLGGMSDGEVFWKIRTGNQFMPSASNALSEEDTWHVANFVRTFEALKPGAHPWTSFPEGAWVEVHTDHEMVMGTSAEPTAWASDSRMTVGSTAGGAVTIVHENPARKISEQASVTVPAVDALPGVRALGQWPHDIFPFGPEREDGVTPADKQPTPQDVKTERVREEEIDVAGKPETARVIEREWKAGRGEEARRHVMTAWVVDGIELPVKWVLSVDGEVLSESELVSLSELVKVGELSIPCVVTLTKKHLTEGTIVKRRWSSVQVPGFMVKMESQMKTDAYSLTVNEWVTGFQSSAAGILEQDEDGGNPPGARPALGFKPDYQSTAGGVLVDEVTAGGPADEGGLLAGDLIIEIDGEDIFGLEDYMGVMSRLRIGNEVTVMVERGKHLKELSVVVGERQG